MTDVMAKHTHTNQQLVEIETQVQIKSLSTGGGRNKTGPAATIDPSDANQKTNAQYDVSRETFLRRAVGVVAFGVPGVS